MGRMGVWPVPGRLRWAGCKPARGSCQGMASDGTGPLHAVVARIKAAPREARVELNRRRLARRFLHGAGLEIGALHRPLYVPPAARVRYVDRMDNSGLRDHYPELDDEALVEVDVVDDGETLATQADTSADFIVANHFIEHTQDPLGTLENHLRVLRPGGVLYLAVPDRRRSFDVDRPPRRLRT